MLEPDERISEVLFGLIMVLTFTGSLSVAEAGRDDVRAMLVGALGCNFAWGIIDGVLYLMGGLAEKGKNLKLFRAVRGTTDSAAARELVASALPPVVASVTRPEELDQLHARLKQLPEPDRPLRLVPSDWLGALGIFLLVFFPRCRSRCRLCSCRGCSPRCALPTPSPSRCCSSPVSPTDAAWDVRRSCLEPRWC
ncbi:MAG: hypothetical protein HC841_06370 [Verrucomicrobiae bacterium]|nr:hypothetical protein [Verrucomicrobiae bacterium]